MKSGTIVLLLASSLLAPSTPAIPRDRAVPGVAPEQALICFYRGLDWDSTRDHYTVRVDDEHVGRLARGSFLYHLTAPGRRIVFVEAEVNVSRSFRIRSGEIHYIRVDRRPGTFPGRPKLLPVEPATGTLELGRLRYSGDLLQGNSGQHCQRSDPS